MRDNLTAPKADALPGCATPRLAECLGKAAVNGNPGDAVRGNERQNTAGTGNETYGISPYPSTTTHEDQYAPEPVSGDPCLHYRLIQDDMPVVWCEGPGALREIQHYALVYSQDGPVRIEQKLRGRWRRVTLAHLHLKD